MIVDGKLGKSLDIQLEHSLDNWSSGAVGSSARVFHAKYRLENGDYGRAALKIMRPDHRDYALPMFIEEFKILKSLADVTGVVHALEYGFVKLDDETKYPDDKTVEGAEKLTGSLLRYSCDENMPEKLVEMKVAEGWLPYIILESKHYSNNLLMLCDPMKTRGKYMAVEESIQVAAGICDILSIAHERHIAYFDHKIVHYYRMNGHDGFPHAYILDWNVGKMFKRLSQEKRKFDIVQFSARTMHYIFAGRAAPGALAVGPTRPEEIQNSPASYGVAWKHDDKRLSDELKQIIEAAVGGQYATIVDLKNDLLENAKNGS